jgi:predicted enzyme related to lactoylglutathione lyase
MDAGQHSTARAVSSIALFGPDTSFAMTAHRRRSARGKPGGHIVKDKFSIGDYGNIALVPDPDGNVVGFHSMV